MQTCLSNKINFDCSFELFPLFGAAVPFGADPSPLSGADLAPFRADTAPFGAVPTPLIWSDGTLWNRSGSSLEPLWLPSLEQRPLLEPILWLPLERRLLLEPIRLP